ncbi:5695_t:CDS:2 [Entrophospora sp. SA101]|nr:6787_t:CDS:2 [Entrophospora sp. SA101]CAJ0632425.1 7496_t:CDS:2 [Entrophospora sp. SA101]CAJ0756612.1 5695_t:CDS:2 [Entrophospora sp. SA101]CAJ0846415.1 8183_t:CDS:2 [Entrophospora sp. SA101]CAJ0847611.1 15963_t:CDS:2 [Entrophospora sp. SA101]
MSETSNSRHIVILGGGVIGCSIAYHITLLNRDPNLKVTVIEQTAIGCAASGKAGGFLTYDWCDKGPLEDLARKSFKLHSELAKTLNGKKRYDYRLVETLSVSASTKAGSVKQPPTNWLKTGVITKYKHIGTKQTTAQLHPYKFTMTLMEEAESRGAKVIIGRVDGIEFDMAKASGVKISTTNEIIAADTVVVAMGPWSGEVLSWLVKKGNRAFQLPDVSGQRAHSIVLKPSVPISAHVCFVSLNLGHRFAEPEIYPRPDGEVYISGECDESTLPESADGYIPNPVAIRNLKNNVNTVSPDVLGCAPVIKEQCCYMPITDDDKPLIGKIPWLDGVYIATGHSVWGILNSSGTGKVIAEMILEGQAKFADVRALAPMRPKK